MNNLKHLLKTFKLWACRRSSTQRLVGHTIVYRNMWGFGKLHREDGPAVELTTGTKAWYKNGQLHREGGPAIEYDDGVKEWWVNGNRHREDGPAIDDINGDKLWYRNGKQHREDGPAVVSKNGRGYWYLNGEQVPPFVLRGSLSNSNFDE